MKMKAIGMLAFALILVATCIMTSSESSADPSSIITQDGVTYTLSEGGGEYYAEASGYDGTTENVTIHASVTYNEISYQVVSVSVGCFAGASNITSIVIEGNTQLSLTSAMLSQLSNLESVSVGEGFTEIPTQFCYRCLKLTTVSLPSTIERIGSSAFAYCPLLDNIVLKNNINVIMDAAFEGCTGLSTIDIPDSVTGMGSRTFNQCTNLASIELGSNLIAIPATAFQGTKITTLTIPATVVEINLGDGGQTSTFPTTLELFIVNPDNAVFESKDGAIYTKSDGKLFAWPTAKGGEITLYDDVKANMFDKNKNITKVTLGEGVTSVGNYAFRQCTNLTEVTFSNTVTSIGSNAFNGCTSLSKVVMPNVPTTIGATAFKKTAITNIDLTHVTSIGNNCFQECSNLVITAIPESVVSIGNSAFLKCSKVSISGLPIGVGNLGASTFRLTAIETISIGQYDSTVTIKGDPAAQIFGGSELKNVCFDNVTTTSSLSDIISLSDSPNLESICFGERFEVPGFVDNSVTILSQTYSDKIVLVAHSGNVTTLFLVNKGQTKDLGEGIAPEGLLFDGWYLDETYLTPYDCTASLNENLSVYAKYKIEVCTVVLTVENNVVRTFNKLAPGTAVTLPVQSENNMNFDGWAVNGTLVGAQYLVSVNDADSMGVITLVASFSPIERTFWTLTVSGDDSIAGKVFSTATNAIGTYGMITVLPDEFETATYTVSANGGYGIISDNCVMVYSIDGNDVSVTVAFQDVGKASEYDVSIAEIVSGGKHGFRATVSADEGYVDADGTFSIRYVYKTWNDDEKVWIYATSGVTTGVDDCTILIPKETKTASCYGDFLLDVEGATLVFGYASYSFKGTVAGAEADIVFVSPVIMSVSEIQAVVGRP